MPPCEIQDNNNDNGRRVEQSLINFLNDLLLAPHLDPGVVEVYTYYDTNSVQLQKEILIYDWPRFLSAIGGTLGLYIGFSCLSIIIWMGQALLGLLRARAKRKKVPRVTAETSSSKSRLAGSLSSNQFLYATKQDRY